MPSMAYSAPKNHNVKYKKHAMCFVTGEGSQFPTKSSL